MNSYEQVPYDFNVFSGGGSDEFLDPEQRCPCVLLLAAEGHVDTVDRRRT